MLPHRCSSGARALSLLVGIVILCCVGPSSGKVIRKKVKFRFPKNGTLGNTVPWVYIGKFGYDYGSSKYDFKARLISPKYTSVVPTYVFETYLDEDWPKAEAETDMCNRKKVARRVRDVKVPKHGQWGAVVNGTVTQNVRPHLWYYALSYCGGKLEGTVVLEVEFSAVQDGDSHFSVDDKWATTANLVCLLGNALFFAAFCYKAREFLSKMGDVHPVIWILGSSAAVQLFAQGLFTIHLLKYKGNGVGIRVCDVMSEIFFLIAQVMQGTIFIMLSRGYTLTTQSMDGETIAPIIALVGLAHVMSVVLDEAQDEGAHVYTEHEGFKGITILLARFGLFAWMLMSAQATAQRGGRKVQRFMTGFIAAAGLYLLAYPFMYFLVKVFAPYLRKPIMEAGIMVAQVVSSVWLARLFLTKGEYFEVSSLGSSPLPGSNSPVGFFDKGKSNCFDKRSD